MKIERISDSIIKVTVSLNDLRERNIDLNELNYNTPAAQEFFFDMMTQAEEQLGFSLSDSQLLIEPVSDSEEGFTITITKIDEDDDFESMQKYIKSRLRKSDLRVKRKSHKIYSSIFVYSFKDIDHVKSLADRLENVYLGNSVLHKYKDTYYLTLTKSGLIQCSLRVFELLLNEYGTKVSNANFFEGYLNEYGEVIIESDALELLRHYF